MVSFSNFHTLDPVAHVVVQDLLVKSDEQAMDFTAFLFRWMAFNGWMSAVTLGNSDAEMVRAIIADPRLESEFDRLMLADLEFSEALKAFATLWPVLNLKDVRAKIGFDVFQRFSRDEVLAGHAGVHVKRQPVGWVAGNTPSWEQTMKVIYEVRCNLFHGEKSPLNYRDAELVHHSNNVLKAYIVKSGCFGWYDAP